MLAEREGSESSHNKGVRYHFSENTPENTSRKLTLCFVRNGLETDSGFCDANRGGNYLRKVGKG